jgi:flagellar hook-associated protein 1 FlgK
VDQSGNDVTEHLTGGKLGALVQFRNETLPYYMGSATTVGQVNRLAETIAQRVNQILGTGYPPPDGPYELFIVGNSPVAIAHAIRLNEAMIPALLESTDKTAVPPRSNGVPLDLAALARPSDDADRIDGLSYAGFFGQLSAHAGRELSNARQERDSRDQMAAQARNFRQQLSGVSLDEEAIRLVEIQRAYQASARMVTALNEIAGMAVNLGRV